MTQLDNVEKFQEFFENVHLLSERTLESNSSNSNRLPSVRGVHLRRPKPLQVFCNEVEGEIIHLALKSLAETYELVFVV